jgi:hypothetical protein
VLYQNFSEKLQSRLSQARAPGTGLGKYEGRFATIIKNATENPCREVDACTDKYLLKIGQVAFFRKWKITLEDYCRPGDSERLQTLKTDLDQLAKLIYAQNRAYSFRMSNILLHYMVNMVADGKLHGIDKIYSRNARMQLWLNNMDNEGK